MAAPCTWSGTLNCWRTSGVRLATARPSLPLLVCPSRRCWPLRLPLVWNSPTVTLMVSGLPSRRMPSSIVVARRISLTATCSALPLRIFLPFSSRSTSPLLRPAWLAGESGVTWLTMAPDGVRQVEEAGVVGRHVVHADAEIAVVHRAGLDDLLGRGPGDLRGNGEAGAGKRAAVGDDEGVDADQLAVRIHQRAAGVAGIDGRVGLNKVAGLARIVGVRIGPVERADDAARDRELEVAEGTAEGQHGLAGMQLGRVAPGNAGQVVRVDLDDGEVVELVHAHQLGGEDAAVVERDANLRCAVHHVVVGDDVAVGRDDDAAADAVLESAAAVSCLARRSRTAARQGRRRTGGIRVEDPAA